MKTLITSKTFKFFIVYLIALTIILLSPFSRKIKTDIQWLPEDHGIQIASTSILRTSTPPTKLYSAIQNGTGITLDMTLSVNDFNQTGPARILSYSNGTKARNLTVGQQNHDLVIRLRNTTGDLNGLPSIVVKHVFTTEEKSRIIFSYDLTEYVVYINGELCLKGQLTASLSNWDPAHFLMLSNELLGDRPWLGRLYATSVYNRPFTQEEITELYRFAKTNAPNPIIDYQFKLKNTETIRDQSSIKPQANLEIPPFIHVGHIPQTDLFGSISHYNYLDILANILLFIPFGIFLSRLIHHGTKFSVFTVLIITLCGASFSFSVEAAQSFMETRYSSLTDITTNTLGTLLGSLLVLLLPQRSS